MPATVRNWADRELGSPVVQATTVLGGFCPGAAARVMARNGARAFVKAAGRALNPDTPALNRREVAALRLLPPSVPHARLLGAYDDGDWVALLLEDIGGQRPAVPWNDTDAQALARTLAVVASTAAPAQLPEFAEVANSLTAWDSIAADPTGISPELLARLPELLDLQTVARDVTRGHALVHWDARNDNVLLRGGEAVLVDWAWACRGAQWLDTLLLTVDFVVQGGPPPEPFLDAHEVTATVPDEYLAAMLACMGASGPTARASRHRPACPRSGSGRRTVRKGRGHG